MRAIVRRNENQNIAVVTILATMSSTESSESPENWPAFSAVKCRNPGGGWLFRKSRKRYEPTTAIPRVNRNTARDGTYSGSLYDHFGMFFTSLGVPTARKLNTTSQAHFSA